MNLVFVGLKGVPYLKRACDVRLASFANILSEKNDVTILNRYCSNPLNKDLVINQNVNIIEIINKKKVYRKAIEFFLFMISIIIEPFRLIGISRRKEIDILHVYSGHFFDFILYYVMSNIIGAKVVYQYVEVRTAKKNEGLYHKINSYLVDNYGYKFFDGVISISEYISEQLKRHSAKLPVIKIPPICNILYFDALSQQIVHSNKDYILFCGSANYFEPIKLIVDSYKESKLFPNCKLYLVLSGSSDSLNKVKQLLTESMVILTELPYESLIKLYMGAKALLIPLRNTTEDTARFPNKICEYTASKGLLITTNYGEVKNYFKDNYNALIADEFSVTSYTGKLNQLFEISDTQLKAMQNRSYEVCKESFDIDVYKDVLHSFLLKIIDNK